ncbi:MAG TPA: DUF1634 domain-containing protein [Terriglobales bacterium]|jgi:uncharacterized membrane protein|nr:DUF1634 domain-containing protein [Terriglobales bacterium]
MAAPRSPVRQQQPWDDHRIEVILGNLLRAGVIFSATIVLGGACIYLFRHAFEQANYSIFRGEPSDFRTIRGVILSVIDGHGRGLIQLGLLVLIATPIIRVAFSIVGFALERDRMYVVFTLIVLAILLYSLLGSGLGM